MSAVLITLKWESMTMCHIGDFIYSSFITDLKWDDRFWYPWPLIENSLKRSFQFYLQSNPKVKVLCMLDFARQLNNDLFLVPSPSVTSVSWLFSWQNRKIIEGGSKKLDIHPFLLFILFLSAACLGFACLPFSPWPIAFQWLQRIWPVHVFQSLLFQLFIRCIFEGNGAEMGHRWLSCLVLNRDHFVVQGGKERNRNAWPQFWNIFRSVQFILKDKKSIGIKKKKKKP